MTGKVQSRHTKIHRKAKGGAPALKTVALFNASKHAKGKQPKKDKPR